MIFPKCQIGIIPQISYEGYMYPCCWIQYFNLLPTTDNNKIKNPFREEDFNINNFTIKEILNSRKWHETLDSLNNLNLKQCSVKCSNFLVKDGKAQPRNSVVPKVSSKNNIDKEFFNALSTDRSIFKNSIIDYSSINSIGIELTSRCSLQCPYCSRTVENGTGTYYKGDLKLQSIERSLRGHKWNRINDCNRYGDSIYYPAYHDFIDLLIENNINKYELSTAATGKGLKWWDSTIQKFSKLNKCEITFGIDGIDEVSSVHRKGQNFNEIWNVMLMAKEAGLDVIWQFIPFKQNEHQINQAETIAKNLGIKFKLHISHRFRGSNDPMIPTDPSLYIS
jgi:uncharacterized radical SAM superfamily Fe-S cluster-containing enzyme